MTQPIIGQTLTSTEGLKPGDLVRAVEGPAPNLTKGKVYPVASLSAEWVRVVDDSGVTDGWGPGDFIYVGPAGTRYVGEQVTVTDAKGKRGLGEVVGLEQDGSFTVRVPWSHNSARAQWDEPRMWLFPPNETTGYGLTLDFKPFEEEAADDLPFVAGTEEYADLGRACERHGLAHFEEDGSHRYQAPADDIGEAAVQAYLDSQPTPITDPQKLVEGATYDVVVRGKLTNKQRDGKLWFLLDGGTYETALTEEEVATAFRSATLVEDKPWKVGDVAVWPETSGIGTGQVDLIDDGRGYHRKPGHGLYPAGGVPLSDLRRPGQ